MRVLVQGGNDAAETENKKQTKMRVVVDIINRFRQLIKHICIKNDNLHKQYFKFTQGSVFLVISTIFEF